MSLKTWLFQKAPRDVRQFLGGRLERAPFVEDLHKQKEDSTGALLQAACNDLPAAGACVAYLHDAPAIALRGTTQWEIDPLVLILSKMDEETESLVESLVEVIHVCRPEQVEAREQLLRERILRAVVDGKDLWNRRYELFPRLDFCEEVERQLLDLSGNEFFFQQIVVALARLHVALGNWSSGILYPGMKSSNESRQTLDHSDYGPMRNVTCPDGQTRCFSNHLKLFSCNWRIHYFETRETGVSRAFVGYIGIHLPTVRYST
jgi:hypothetical protein